MYELMGYLAAGALLATAISMVAVWCCQYRHIRPSFLISVAATALSGVIIVAYVFRGELLHWNRWVESGAKGFPLCIAVPLIALSTLPSAGLASATVVYLYQIKYDKELPRV